MITLDDLINYPPCYLGTVDYFKDLYTLFEKQNDWKRSDLNKYFQNKIYTYPYINKALDMLIFSDILTERKSTITRHNFIYSKSEKKNLANIILQAFFKKLTDTGNLLTIFPDGSINIDSLSGHIILDKKYQKLKYAPIWNLVFDMQTGIFKNQDIPINNHYIKEFFNLNSDITKNTMSIEELKTLLLNQENAGRKAEEFVFNYERLRLMGHNSIENITQISDLNTSAGYDIISYNSPNSKNLDRFIEVKSYDTDSPHFYWSQNEMEVAMNKRDNYCLYLVNRTKMTDYGYVPEIVHDPYSNIYKSNEWLKEPQVLHLRKII